MLEADEQAEHCHWRKVALYQLQSNPVNKSPVCVGEVFDLQSTRAGDQLSWHGRQFESMGARSFEGHAPDGVWPESVTLLLTSPLNETLIYVNGLSTVAVRSVDKSLFI